MPPSHPLQKALEEWGASVEKDSGGTIKYKVYPAQQLGKAFDHYDMARDGIADLTYINPGYQPGRFPIIAAGELPFLMANAKGGSQALDAWYRKYAAKEMKDVKFCLAFVHDPGTFHSSEQEDPGAGRHQGHEDPPGARHHGDASSPSSAAPTCSPRAPEVRDILEQGVADAVTFPWGSVPLFGIDKVTKYHMDVPLYVTTFAFVFNKAQIRPDVGRAEEGDRRPLHQRMGAARSRGPWADFEHAGIAKIKAEPGHEVYELTPAQARGMEEGGRAAREDLGRQRQEGRRRSGRGDEGAAAPSSPNTTRWRTERMRRDD